MSSASETLSPLTSSSGENLILRSLKPELSIPVKEGLTDSFIAALYSLEEILSTFSRGILLVMFPIATVTALLDTLVTSPTIPLSFTRTFSPTCNGPGLNLSCSWGDISRLTLPLRASALRFLSDNCLSFLSM